VALHFYDILYLSAVKYNPMTTEVIFIRVTGDPGPTWKAKKATNSDIFLIRVYAEPGILPLQHEMGSPWPLPQLIKFSSGSKTLRA
jgi:hypothetical protein